MKRVIVGMHLSKGLELGDILDLAFQSSHLEQMIEADQVGLMVTRNKTQYSGKAELAKLDKDLEVIMFVDTFPSVRNLVKYLKDNPSTTVLLVSQNYEEYNRLMGDEFFMRVGYNNPRVRLLIKPDAHEVQEGINLFWRSMYSPIKGYTLNSGENWELSNI